MFDGRASLPKEVKADIEQFLNNARGTTSAWAQACVLPTFIRRNIKLAEAPSYGKTIFEYERNCHGAEDYSKVAEFIHAQSQPPIHPEISQPTTTGKIQDQSSSPLSSPSPLDSQASVQPSIHSVDTDKNQTQLPIEIKSISPSKQKIQADSNAKTTESVDAAEDDAFTRITNDTNQPESGQPEY